MHSTQVRARDSSAAGVRWLEEHGDALYRYALPRVRNPEAAEDLVQETLLAALAGRRSFAGHAAERTWLVAILKHKLVDHLRNALRQRPLAELQGDHASAMFDQSGHWSVRVSNWEGDPQAVLENAEFRDTLASCLARLPSRIAQLFWLREVEGIRPEQLCQELGISATNLWTMMHRARLRLRRCLSLNWFEGGKK